MRIFKKALAAMLSAAMLVSAMAIPSFADTAAPSATAKDLSKATVKLSATSFTYNGKKQGPKVTVTLDGDKLTSGTDYSVSGATATNAGKHTVTVEGLKPYTGKKTATFTIAKAKLTSVTLKSTSATWTGKSLKDKIAVKTVKAGKLTLKASDYTVKLPKTVKDSGEYTVTVTGKGNFTGSASATFTVKPKTKKAKAITATAKASKSTVKNTKKQTVTIKTTIKTKGAKKAPVTVTFSGKKSLKKYVTISGKKITFKKKAATGSYKFTVQIGAYNNYKAKKLTVTIKVKK